jgi:hypothetical protein
VDVLLLSHLCPCPLAPTDPELELAAWIYY